MKKKGRFKIVKFRKPKGTVRKKIKKKKRELIRNIKVVTEQLRLMRRFYERMNWPDKVDEIDYLMATILLPRL